MKIGFDARMISNAGIGSYISSLLTHMTKQSPDDNFILFGDPVRLACFEAERNVKIVKWTAPIYTLREQILPPPCFADMDVFHVPHFNIPLAFKNNMVVTIHDLIYLLIPESHPSPLAKAYAGFFIKRALQSSKSVIAVSNNTAEDLIKCFGTEYGGRIKVVYEGVGQSCGIDRDPSRMQLVREKYGLSEKIILYVGAVKPHKNVGALLKVYEMLRSWGIPHQLVICGRWDRKEDKLKGPVDTLGVKYLGEVSREDLGALYGMAETLVHLSLYEGFGLTLLEAMQCGTPVVTVRNSSIPEVVGDAALITENNDIKCIADTVYNVLMSPEMRSKLSELGRKQAAKFSWESAAARTLAVYRASIGQRA
ncbi:MAG: glycosyltransferase family 4 protein [Candidatus Omnitrophica bacterium]|nr:glycosyltransferase family 4 protein [Candidatus Omnitrophota bacterium]